MKHRFNLWLLMTKVVFLFYFSANSFAESTLVVGNSDNLINLTYTKYLDNRPVLFFTEQEEDKKIDLLNKIDNIVFCDNTWQDLAVEFATQSTVFSPQSIFEIKKNGVYELWFDHSGFDIEKKELQIGKLGLMESR